MNYITTEWSMLWIVGCIALSLAVSYVLYGKVSLNPLCG